MFQSVKTVYSKKGKWVDFHRDLLIQIIPMMEDSFALQARQALFGVDYIHERGTTEAERQMDREAREQERRRAFSMFSRGSKQMGFEE